MAGQTHCRAMLQYTSWPCLLQRPCHGRPCWLRSYVPARLLQHLQHDNSAKEALNAIAMHKRRRIKCLRPCRVRQCSCQQLQHYTASALMSDALKSKPSSTVHKLRADPCTVSYQL